MTIGRLVNFAGSDFSEVWLRTAGERADLEYRLLGSILRDPLIGLAMADDCGVDAQWFSETDLQTVYLAAVVRRQLGRLIGERYADQLSIALLARDSFQTDGLWEEPSSGRMRGPVWSNESLDLLFYSEFTALLVPAHAGRLDELITRQREATAHLRYAWKLLNVGTEAVA